jgi:low molecular weight protein-tyrosine phosphatase
VSRSVLFLCTGNYFRSRFAEALFNHLAAVEGVAARAVSAGLAPQCHLRNPGPISLHTLAGLRARGIAPPVRRPPRDVTEEDLTAAAVVVAVKGAEHRPFVERYFPSWVDRIRYWNVDDVPHVPPEAALTILDAEVRALLAELR